MKEKTKTPLYGDEWINGLPTCGGMTHPIRLVVKAKRERVAKLAAAFVAVAIESLSADEMRQVRERNKKEKREGVCHTHDFCDANMLMDAAFVRAFGFGPLDDGQRDPADGGMTQENVDLWNEAWDAAKKSDFQPGKSKHRSDAMSGSEEAKRASDLVAIESAMATLQAAGLAPFDLYAYAVALDALEQRDEVRGDGPEEFKNYSVEDALQEMHDADVEDGSDAIDGLYDRALKYAEAYRIGD